MAGGRYTVEQLEYLRDSPLVKKPDALPLIEQWMDVPNDNNNNNNNNNANNAGNATNRRTRANREGDAGATGGEQRSERPLLGAMGQFGRRASTQHGDEPVIGGPPKLNFASATRSKPGQAKEATGITSIDGEHTGDRFPRNDRWRDGDRTTTRDKDFPNGRRARREEGEGWQKTQSRKSLGQEDFDRGFGRNGDRKDPDAENGDGLPRRRGDRWGRREETKENEGAKFATTAQGGWRERNRERDKERDWTRSGGKAEEDPEWMDAPVPKKETKAHTQEDFQRWKEQMKAKDTPLEEREESKPPELPSFFSDALPHQPLQSAGTPSGLEPNLGSMFGTWSASIKAAESAPLEPAPVKAKPAKASRFMNMFAKPEESPAVAAAAATPPPAPLPAFSAPPPPTDTNADQEGFQRILQMLGGTGIGSAPAPAPPPSNPTPSNGLRLGGGISLDFHQSPPPLPEMQERRAPPHQMPSRSSLETQALLENILAPRPSVDRQQSRFNSMSPDNSMFEQFGIPRPDSNRPDQQPPSRNNNPQDPNLAALLNSRSQVNRDKGSSAERDFLLNLMQQPRNTPPQLGNQNLPLQNMPFLDQNRLPQGLPKGRGGPPPGFINERMDPRMDAMYMENELMRQEQERRNQVRELQQQEAARHKGGRVMPLGFPENERDVMANLQRRNTAGEIPRQMTNMGIPSQHVPDLPYMSGGRQPGMPPTPQEGPNVRPPPGFNGPMRQPPGLGGPPPQHQMGPVPSFSAGNTPMGPPPGFNPANSIRPGMFPGGPGGPGGPGNGMQGPPQGYFPPPQGYGPPMGMRGEDPRLMFEQQQFGGPGQRQQQQQGRPPNMY
ncbi:hypothetical protein P171DRAFT_212 [Karstenula rhodostoma CBS 690.94]|uniref:Uncharacterized protein n=1 Tax=Karstenula rhodostoma CBS 690.94 TaxID=1392251 RepID=A0A9P4PXS5_9PLEO|nr:hypothetical protein P171DRAFT_212 [Karstenula rhodostoma CBS 690.94]